MKAVGAFGLNGFCMCVGLLDEQRRFGRMSSNQHPKVEDWYTASLKTTGGRKKQNRYNQLTLRLF